MGKGFNRYAPVWECRHCKREYFAGEGHLCPGSIKTMGDLVKYIGGEIPTETKISVTLTEMTMTVNLLD